MKKMISVVMCAAMSLAAMSVSAAERGTKEEAKAMAIKGVEFAKAHGPEKLIAAVNAKDPQFIDRDLYISIYNMKGTNVAHGVNQKMVGKDMMNLVDVDNKPYIKERIEIATTKGSGWQDFKFLNPVTKAIEPKSMYVQKVGDIIIGVGAYQAGN